MNFAKKVLLCIDLNDAPLETLNTFKELNFLNQSEVHLAYVFQTTTLSHGFWDYDFVYPVEQDRKSIGEVAQAALTDIAKEGFGPDFKGKVFTHCLFGENTKYAMSDFIKSNDIDLVVLWARAKHGMFDGSFSQYVNKHTKSNVLIMKKQA